MTPGVGMPACVMCASDLYGQDKKMSMARCGHAVCSRSGFLRARDCGAVDIVV